METQINGKNVKHLGIFIPSLRGGGVERVVINLLSEAIHDIERIDLILLSKTGRFVEQVPPSVHVFDLESQSALRGILPLMRYLKEEAPDILLSGVPQANFAALIASLLSQSKSKRIISVHNIQTKQRLKGFRARVLLAGIRLAYPLADNIIAVSENVRQALFMHFPVHSDKIDLVHNPINVNTIRGRIDESARHPWLTNKTTPVLITACRLVDDKDLGTLIEAVSLLEKHKNARLIVLGEGPLRTQLTRRIQELGLSESVDLAGFYDNPFAEIARSDLFVLPSKFEGFGNVIIEALACGTRVLSTANNGGVADFIAEDDAVQLTPIGDAPLMAGKIEEMLDLPKVTQVCEMIACQFTEDIAWQKYYEILQDSLRSNRPKCR